MFTQSTKRVLMGYEFPPCRKDSNIRLTTFPLFFWCCGNYCSRALQTNWNDYNAALVYDIKAEILKRKDKDRHYCLTLYPSVDMYELTLLWDWPPLRKDSVFDLYCHQLLLLRCQSWNTTLPLLLGLLRRCESVSHSSRSNCLNSFNTYAMVCRDQHSME